MASADIPKFVATFRNYEDYPKILLNRSHQLEESQLLDALLSERAVPSFRDMESPNLSTPVLDFDFEQGVSPCGEDIKDIQTLLAWLMRRPAHPPGVSPVPVTVGKDSKEQSRNNSVSFHTEDITSRGNDVESFEPKQVRMKLQDNEDLSHSKTSRHPKLEFQPYETYRKDPKCRFIFLNSQTSRSPLNIDIDMFRLIMTFHQVMPEFLDFILVFGNEDARGERFCSFNVQKQLKDPAPRHLEIANLGRSGRYYQMCYNFRSPAPLDFGSETKRATFRQAIFHHQFDVVEGSSLWITAKGKTKDAQPVETTIGNDFTPGVTSSPPKSLEDYFRLTLDVHKLNCNYATINWRTCIEAIETQLDDFQKELEPGSYLSPDPDFSSTTETSVKESFAHINPDTLRKIQIIEENIVNVILVLKSNIDTLHSLSSFYDELAKYHADELALKTETLRKDVGAFEQEVLSFEAYIKRLIIRTERLVKVAGDSKSIVIKRMEFLASNRMETLTKKTVDLTLLAQKEAIAVKVITIVTLLYLPSSAISSFFSTDVIKFQTEDSGGGAAKPSYSAPALYMWLEVTIPFTVGTLLIGFFFYKMEQRRQRGKMGADLEKLQENELDDDTFERNASMMRMRMTQ